MGSSLENFKRGLNVKQTANRKPDVLGIYPYLTSRKLLKRVKFARRAGGLINGAAKYRLIFHCDTGRLYEWPLGVSRAYSQAEFEF